jgi:hypothetical protein
LAVAGAVSLGATSASAQATGQLWTNITLDWVKSSSLTYEVDIEPKTLISASPDEPGWRNLDITPSVEYAALRRLDVVGELTVGRTNQTDNVDTSELTARMGARFHLFSRQQRVLLREQLPKRGLVVRDLVRVEFRNFSYSNDQPSETSVRFRNRVEFLNPLNRPNLGDDGVVYVLADWEWFIPVSDVDERFANRQRVRVGFGFRRSFAWRFAAIYMWTRSRETISDGFTTNEHILDFQVKRVW